MILPDKLRQDLGNPKRVHNITSQLQALNANQCPLVTLFTLTDSDKKPIKDWLEKLEHLTDLIDAIIDETHASRSLKGPDFIAYYGLKSDLVNKRLKKKTQLTVLQAEILKAGLGQEAAGKLIEHIKDDSLPINNALFSKLLDHRRCVEAISEKSYSKLQKQVFTDLQRYTLAYLKRKPGSHENLKALFEGTKVLHERFQKLIELNDSKLAQSYFKSLPAIPAEERLKLYSLLLKKHRTFFNYYLAGEKHLDDIIMAAATPNHIKLFTEIVAKHKKPADRQRWARSLAAKRQCPLAALLVLAEHGANLDEVEENTERNFYHIATEAENDDIIRHLLSCEAAQKHSKENPRLCAYHKDSSGISALDIAKQKNNRRILDLYRRYGYQVESPKPAARQHFDPTSKQFLVFCGGGVKAVAYSPALETYLNSGYLDLDCIRGTAGTSAGAIAALLVSLNYSMREMDETLKTFNLKDLIDFDAKDFKLEDLSKVGSYLQKLSANIVNSTDLLSYMWQYIRGKGEMAKVLALKDTITKNGGGICKGEKLTQWFKDIVARKVAHTTLKDMPVEHITFGDLAGIVDEKGSPVFKDLRIMAVNLRRGMVQLFSPDRTPNVTVVSAMRATVSMPLIFTPTPVTTRRYKGHLAEYVQSNDRYVDGGIMNNFPFYAYSDHDPKHQMTYGFYLANEEDVDDLRHGRMVYTNYQDSAEPDDSLDDFSNALLRILQCPQENIFADDIVRHYTLFIPVSNEISAFDVSDPDKQLELEAAGFTAAKGRIAYHNRQMRGNFSPYLYKLIARLGYIRFDNQSKDIFLTQPNFSAPKVPGTNAPLIAAEILKIYARATDEEVKYLPNLINPNLAGSDGLTPLHIAYAFNLDKTASRLLRANAHKHAVWHTPTGQNLSAKSCKHGNDMRSTLIGLGVPDYFNLGEDQVRSTKKMRLNAHLNTLETELGTNQKKHVALKGDLGALQNELSRERAQHNALYLALLRLKTAENHMSESQLRTLVEKLFKENLALHDESYQSLKNELEAKLISLQLSEKQSSKTQDTAERLREDLTNRDRHIAKLEQEQNQDSQAIISLKSHLAESALTIKVDMKTLESQGTDIAKKKAQIAVLQDELEEKNLELENTNINRTKWRDNHPEYLNRFNTRLTSLMDDLRREIKALKESRQNIFLKIFLPLVPLFMGFKIRHKAEKIKALESVRKLLKSDNTKTTSEIIKDVESNYPALRSGLFSRCRMELDKMAALERKNCNLDFGLKAKPA